MCFNRNYKNMTLDLLKQNKMTFTPLGHILHTDVSTDVCKEHPHRRQIDREIYFIIK